MPANFHPPRGQAGFMLVVVPVVIGALLVMGLQMIGRSRAAMRTSSSDLNSLQTGFCAQRCATLAANRIQRALEDNLPIAARESDCRCGDGEAGNAPSGCTVAVTAPSEGVGLDCYGLTVHTTEVGLASRCDGRAETRSDLELDVAYRETPLFQFAVFYDGYLGIRNTPPMVLGGRVHSNDTIELDPREYLSVEDWMTTPRVVVASKDRFIPDIHFARMDGTPDPAPVRPDNEDPSPLHAIIPDYETWKAGHRVAYDGQPNGCGPVRPFRLPVRGLRDARDIIEWRSAGDDAAMRRIKFAHKAGLLFRGGRWMDRDLVPVAFGDDPVRVPDVPSGWSTEVVDGRTRVLFWDTRDTLMLKLLPVDIARLQARSTGDSLVYLHDELADPSQRGQIVGGFLLHNGGRLVAPLTVSTNSRMFLLGDFNTDSAYVSDGLRYPFPAALVSDNFTQLSNHVIPSEHLAPGMGSDVRDRHPSARTTVNVCILTGVVYGPDGGEPNGLENLVRFLEDWGRSPYARSGSTACLWESRHSRGQYIGQRNIYHPPLREFSFSRMYRSMGNMPPGTPRLVVPDLLDREWVRD